MSCGSHIGGVAALVVDDEPLVRMYTAVILEQAGFDVEEASSSEEALSKLNAGCRIDALVTDVQMPGAVNGLGLAKHVHGLFPKAAVIVISGVAKPAPGDMPPNAIFLAKPVVSEHLVRALNDALERLKN
jgi:DNA-binding NtrC family response regulator